jgi:putative transposase
MLTYKYKLYKSDKSNRLDRLIETERRIWNYCTAIQKIAYRLYKTYIPLSKMRKQVANLRKRNPYWMKLNSQTVQEIVDRHDASYQRFFLKLQKRPPKFHKYGKDGSVVYTQSGYKLEPNRLRIKNVGSFGFHKSRDFEKPKRIILKRKGNDYFVFVACDVAPKQHARVDNRTVGIDFGMKTFITFDNGETIENPQFLYNMLHEVQHRNRCLSRRAKNSNSGTRPRPQRRTKHKRRGHSPFDR